MKTEGRANERLCGRNMLRVLESRVTVILKRILWTGFYVFFIQWVGNCWKALSKEWTYMTYIIKGPFGRGVYTAEGIRQKQEDKTGYFHNNLGKGSNWWWLGPECLLLQRDDEKWLDSRFILNIYLESVNLGLARLWEKLRMTASF